MEKLKFFLFLSILLLSIFFKIYSIKNSSGIKNKIEKKHDFKNLKVLVLIKTNSNKDKDAIEKYFLFFHYIFPIFIFSNGEEYKYKIRSYERKNKDLMRKCKNSEFDDNPEITAYIQVRDLDNDEVFLFSTVGCFLQVHR